MREEIILESLAAATENNLLEMPAPPQPTILHRLPRDYRTARSKDLAVREESQSAIGMDNTRLFQRHEGGLLSRALGSAVHALLESLAKLRKTFEWDQARAALGHLQPRIAAQIRAAGMDSSNSNAIAAEALRLALDASHDLTGNWILSPHCEDSSEVRWTGVIAGNLRTVQVDRLFRAGPAPQSEGDEAWWIVDYKTAHADIADQAAAMPQLRATFAPQLEAYAEVLANLRGKDTPIRAGLYYPRMLLFDWWKTQSF